MIAAFLLVGTEAMALGIFGAKAWARCVLQAAAADAMPIQVQAGQFAFYFRYPGPDGKFGPHSRRQDRRSKRRTSFGLDPTNDQDSKDDIVAAEMAIPVNREIHLLMHSKDVGPFVLRPRTARAAGLCSWAGCFAPFHRDQGRASTKSSAPSFVASGTTT